METKKSVMGPIISVFVLVLVIAILAGMTFLFTSNLGVSFKDTAPLSDNLLVKNETINVTILSGNTGTSTELSANNLRSSTCSVLWIQNASGIAPLGIKTANYTSSNCEVTNLTSDAVNGPMWNVTYTYQYKPFSKAETSVNKTEQSGFTVVGFLPLIFLAIIFGTLLTLVLKIILPYLNLGQQMGGF